jgi:ABC-type Mn2+/Zn2+ transport system permease subunit
MTESEIFKTIISEFPFALFGSMVAGGLLAFLGVYIISKRIVFVGATLTQIAVAGIAFAHLPFIGINPIIGSLMFTILAVLLFSQVSLSRNVPRDAILGMSFVAAMALRILIIQKSPAAEIGEIDSILKGDILFISAEQFFILLAVAAFVIIIHLLFYKEFTFVSFDPETAATQGIKPKWWELFFYFTIGIAISVATRVVGDVFVFGFLVIPAVTALIISRNVVRIFLTSILLGILPPFLGMYFAFKLDLPTGPTAVTTSILIFVLMWVIAKIIRR